MGPMELADYVGLDTTKFIIDGMYTESISSCASISLDAKHSTWFINHPPKDSLTFAVLFCTS